MDTNGSGFHHLGFSLPSSSNAFLNLSKVVRVGGIGSNHCTDTDLRLDSISASFPNQSIVKGVKRKLTEINGSMGSEDGFSLVLGLGRPQSSSDSKGSSATACTSMSSPKEIEEESSMDLNLDFDLHLGNDKIGVTTSRSASVTPKAPELKPKFDLELSLSTGPAESDLTSITLGSNIFQKSLGISRLVDEESASSHWKRGKVVPQFLNLHDNGYLINQIPGKSSLIYTVPDFSPTMVTTPKSSVTCTSGLSHQQQRSSNSKTCQFSGCGKGARGASGLCIAHGGGRRCQKTGCHKGAEGRTVYCKAHGGGRRCQYLGCTKSAEGRTDYCIAHGGGRRCSHEGCSRAARGRSGLCIRHGGGKRCQKENCTKSAEGFSGLCISHGGGRRCQYPECTKGAQGSTMFCKAHGGGKRCTIPGCTKGAEGSTPFCKGHGGGKRCSFEGGGICPKSVHGGTLYCVAHGGGKRCAVPDCTKSARGRTDFCVRHGGGKRCKFEGCGKSAQGSTDFCKAHGGGKRCSWGQPGSGFGTQAVAPCDRFARGKTGLCASHSALVQDKRVHGGGTLVSTILDPKSTNSETMKVVVDMHIDDPNIGTEDNSPDWNGFDSTQFNHQGLSLHFMPPVLPIAQSGLAHGPVAVPEGRVHGGSLMAMLKRTG
ncbi:Wrky transcription factor [Thalictrum thalictroides]|uniref:Wrky transcription factor n=1 Tax=Thalictrum thalictroides TaxID=46969 RepID=A0A7J6WG20_THATH|nr:Wrky transcription factor [Thalictrum thalictroides]